MEPVTAKVSVKAEFDNYNGVDAGDVFMAIRVHGNLWLDDGGRTIARFNSESSARLVWESFTMNEQDVHDLLELEAEETSKCIVDVLLKEAANARPTK